jgi:hypothetical protein
MVTLIIIQKRGSAQSQREGCKEGTQRSFIHEESRDLRNWCYLRPGGPIAPSGLQQQKMGIVDQMCGQRTNRLPFMTSEGSELKNRTRL